MHGTAKAGAVTAAPGIFEAAVTAPALAVPCI